MALGSTAAWREDWKSRNYSTTPLKPAEGLSGHPSFVSLISIGAFFSLFLFWEMVGQIFGLHESVILHQIFFWCSIGL